MLFLRLTHYNSLLLQDVMLRHTSPKVTTKGNKVGKEPSLFSRNHRRRQGSRGQSRDSISRSTRGLSLFEVSPSQVPRAERQGGWQQMTLRALAQKHCGATRPALCLKGFIESTYDVNPRFFFRVASGQKKPSAAAACHEPGPRPPLSQRPSHPRPPQQPPPVLLGQPISLLEAGQADRPSRPSV